MNGKEYTFINLVNAVLHVTPRVSRIMTNGDKNNEKMIFEYDSARGIQPLDPVMGQEMLCTRKTNVWRTCMQVWYGVYFPYKKYKHNSQ